MSGYLDELEERLIDAASAPRRGPERRAARRRAIPASAVAALAALLVASAVALAVSGTFSAGSPVRPPERPLASRGAGIAERGTRLLGIRVADPIGGLPWGMRVVRTTRGLECLQIGRVDGSELGVLGQNGAFNDDGRFHPVTADVVGYHRATTELSSCLPPGQTTSQEAGIPQSGVFGSPHSESIPPTARRQISFGLLGPRAVSVTYEQQGTKRTIPVEPGSGAYLVVTAQLPKASFETGGGAFSDNGFLTPQGAISAITYRVHGRLCSETRPAGQAASKHPPCPRQAPAPRPGRPRRLHRPVRVLVAPNGTAVVTFTAPRSVTSAISDYAVQVPAPCHKGTDETPVERNVRAAQLVHVSLPGLFANACGHTVIVRVVYERNREALLGSNDLIVGETAVTR